MTEKPLANRVALVTGGARGIGLATCHALAAMGSRVGIVDIDDAAACAAASALAAETGSPCAGSGADVSDVEACRRAFDSLSVSLGPPVVLVNNAGIMPQQVRPIHEQTSDNFDRMLAIHLGGAAHFSQLCIPAMREAGFGRIINLSSVLGLVGLPFRAGYAAAKTGMNGLTRALAVETARFGITVNAVAPGYILTDILRERAQAGLLDYDLYAHRTPVGRWGKAEEIARVIAFLAHPDSSYITGAVWPVDGGYTVRGDPGEDIGPLPS